MKDAILTSINKCLDRTHSQHETLQFVKQARSIKCVLWCWSDLPVPDDQTSPETLPLFLLVVSNKHVTGGELAFGRSETYDLHFLKES